MLTALAVSTWIPIHEEELVFRLSSGKERGIAHPSIRIRKVDQKSTIIALIGAKIDRLNAFNMTVRHLFI